jgi:WD40 repeat protein
VYAVGQREPLFTTGAVHPHRAFPSGRAVFSAGGDLLAFSANEHWVEVVSARTGKTHKAIERPPDGGAVDALAFSPDGKSLAVSSGFLYHKELHLFDTATGNLLGHPVKDVDGIAHQMLFSADGKRVIANHFAELYLVDNVARRLTATLKAQVGPVFFQGNKLYSLQGKAMAIHEVTDKGIEKNAIGHFADNADLEALYRSAVAGQPGVATVTIKNEVSVRDMQGKERFRVAGGDAPITRVCLSADGRVVLIHRQFLRVEVFRLK